MWRSTYQSNLKRIFLLQKKLIRIISKDSFDAHTGTLFKDLQILKFHDIYQYHTGKLMFLFTKNLLPNYFKSMFILTSQVHSYNTRTSNCSICFLVELTSDNFRFAFKDQSFLIRWSSDIKDCEAFRYLVRRSRNFSCLCKSCHLGICMFLRGFVISFCPFFSFYKIHDKPFLLAIFD